MNPIKDLQQLTPDVITMMMARNDERITLYRNKGIFIHLYPLGQKWHLHILDSGKCRSSISVSGILPLGWIAITLHNFIHGHFREGTGEIRTAITFSEFDLKQIHHLIDEGHLPGPGKDYQVRSKDGIFCNTLEQARALMALLLACDDRAQFERSEMPIELQETFEFPPYLITGSRPVDHEFKRLSSLPPIDPDPEWERIPFGEWDLDKVRGLIIAGRLRGGSSQFRLCGSEGIICTLRDQADRLVEIFQEEDGMGRYEVNPVPARFAHLGSFLVEGYRKSDPSYTGLRGSGGPEPSCDK